MLTVAIIFAYQFIQIPTLQIVPSRITGLQADTVKRIAWVWMPYFVSQLTLFVGSIPV